MTIPRLPFVIAEAGVNHNGDPALARRLVDAAADCGADAVKFQHFDPARLTAESAEMADYQKANLGHTKTQREMLSELTLSRDDLSALSAHAAARDLQFMCTPFDEASADQIADLVSVWKVSSTDLTNWPLLSHLCGHRKPVLLSTGMSTMEEVMETVEFLKPIAHPGGESTPVTVLHCVSAYPAPLAQINLAAIPEMAAATGVPVGYSDHTLGIGAAVAATALGATVIEKHLTLDTEMEGPDHRASLDPLRFKTMVDAIRDAALAVGEPIKAPQASEQEHRLSVRRGLYFTGDFPAGHRLVIEDLVALRPATAFPPSRRDSLLGRSLVRAVTAGAPLVGEDLAP